MKKERKGSQGRMGGRRKQKEVEGRKRKGRELFLCGLLLAPQESLWAGKEGSVSWREQGVCQRTPHPTSCCPNLPLVGLRLLWLQTLSASLWGLGFSHQGPTAKVSSTAKALLLMPIPKTFPAVPYPTAVFKLTPVSPTPCFRLGLGQHPTASQRVIRNLREVESALFTF